MTKTTVNTPVKLTTAQEEFAQALYKTYVNVGALNEDDWKERVLDDATACRVQARVMELKNQPVGGYKVSLTSEETQKMFASTSPLYGAQVADRFLKSPAHVELKKLNEPLVEVELAFRAKEDLAATDTLEDLFNKTTVAGAVEVPDARFSDWFPSLSKYMVMSDCAVGGLVVYGKEFDTNKAFKTPAALANVNCELYHDNKKLLDGKSSEVLGNPLNSLKWLVEKLAEQGKTFTANTVVSSGTFLLPPTLSAGKWQATFDNNLGTVTVDVAAK
ncbi:2-keto-4-pentenoate hydratase [Ligilactobacillus sp. WILCCON 0076]|uniref:2-keto-4-pentenoate hydratase n=1 Tax=Ligilactobacillus ubinensis TaxID=2876789 RepID=A0A9X2FG70_9LACO|nr:2-keto-4-pentenoate hydratase [Ligilactobacillus ubinensis]MCP0885859.1 2-keto-4-pentenoate hydratase [Ligilactobacillus ubinensis]